MPLLAAAYLCTSCLRCTVFGPTQPFLTVGVVMWQYSQVLRKGLAPSYVHNWGLGLLEETDTWTE